MAITQTQLERVVCPVCYGRLVLLGDAIGCEGCGRRYPIVDGLPVLLAGRAMEPHESV